MKATIKELRKTMFYFDIGLIVNKNRYTNPEGRKFLYDIENQDLEINFYIGSDGVFVIEKDL